MRYQQKVAIMRAALQAVGLSAEEASRKSYNTLRRFLPTAAGLLQCPDNVKQAIGSWDKLAPADKDQIKAGCLSSCQTEQEKSGTYNRTIIILSSYR